MNWILIFLFLALVSSQNEQGNHLRFNCGGDEYIDTQGNQWEVDWYIRTGGQWDTVDIPIANTNDDIIYQTEIYGLPYFLIPGTSKGVYKVTFYFAEKREQNRRNGARVFNVTLNGNRVLANFDVFAEGGFATPVTKSFLVHLCYERIPIMIRLDRVVGDPFISGIEIELQENVPLSCTYSYETIPSVPSEAKYNYSEALHYLWYFYEAQRSGDVEHAAIRRLAWRRNSSPENRQVDGRYDLSGGFYEAANRMKYGLPLAFTWTVIAWTMIEYREAYEKTGELMYAMDHMKWANDYFINAHIEPNKFYGQVGLSDYDFTYCGPPELFTLPRPAFLLTSERNSTGTEIVCETAAAMAAASIVFRSTNSSYADTLLLHARQLYTFGTTYLGSYQTVLPDHHKWYPTIGYGHILPWSAAWLYKATGEQAYLNDAIRYYNEYVAFNPGTFDESRDDDVIQGFSFSWGERYAGLHVLMAKITGESSYRATADQYFDNWLPKPTRTVAHTPKGLAYRDAWGPLRYAANTAFIMMVYADYIRTLDPSDPQTREFVNGTRASELFNYATKQVNYMLGDNGRSYLVGFGENYPRNPYYMTNWAPVIDFPYWRTHDECDAAFKGPENSRMIAYGLLVGGPSFDDSYDDIRSNNFVRAEPTQDYIAALAGVLARLVSYYDQGPYCGVPDLGWSHPNATSGNYTPSGLKHELPICRQNPSTTSTPSTSSAPSTPITSGSAPSSSQALGTTGSQVQQPGTTGRSHSTSSPLPVTSSSRTTGFVNQVPSTSSSTSSSNVPVTTSFTDFLPSETTDSVMSSSENIRRYFFTIIGAAIATILFFQCHRVHQ